MAAQRSAPPAAGQDWLHLSSAQPAALPDGGRKCIPRPRPCRLGARKGKGAGKRASRLSRGRPPRPGQARTAVRGRGAAGCHRTRAGQPPADHPCGRADRGIGQQTRTIGHGPAAKACRRTGSLHPDGHP
ncbi:UNVERIFIED_CONTAM: hypothetical protein NCL1_38123 [Trichonephila clavipes]